MGIAALQPFDELGHGSQLVTLDLEIGDEGESVWSG